MPLRRQSLSPTANLLRNSRLFSLPNPLPRPVIGETSGAGTQRVSDSATLPYPTHQAIATTPSSLARGDWGLKRPLPSRSHLVQTSNPVLRIKQLDTVEHVTDFESAGDHVRTREKWAEMGTPMMRLIDTTKAINAGAKPKSAFEDSADVSAYENEDILDEKGRFLAQLRKNIIENAKQSSEGTGSYVPMSAPERRPTVPTGRWKHEGPWLPGMSATEFAAYITNQLARRRAEFNRYLVHYARNEIYTVHRAAAMARKEEIPLDHDEAETWMKEKEREWSNISQAEIDAKIRDLRADCSANTMASRLVQNLIIPFLRLPPMEMKNSDFRASGAIQGWKFTDESTPLTTHPSAGLGYLRSKSYLANHPLLGPQAHPSPVAARVIQPRKSARGRDEQAKFGVGGFVANDEYKSQLGNSNVGHKNDVETVDVDTPGGQKVMVEPMFASVAPDGRVQVMVKRSRDLEIQVGQGQLEEIVPLRENATQAPLDLTGFGRSGIKELDEQSEQKEEKETHMYKQFMNVMGTMESQSGQRKAQVPFNVRNLRKTTTR